MNVLNQYKLDKELAIITGGAGLLGIQHCEGLLEAGAQVIAVDIDISSMKLENLRNSYKKKFNFYKCDISKESEIIKLKETIHKDYERHPSILINNAAIDPKQEVKGERNSSRLESFDIDQWNKEVAVGLNAAMICTKHFGIEMANENKGVILNISSDLGLIAPNQSLYESEDLEDQLQNVKPVTYSVIKHGLIGLTRYISTYWANKGVRCNALAPGGVYNGHSDEFVSKINNLIPLGRMAKKDEYRSAIQFLCSDASSYMNGQNIVIDGGRSIL